MAEHICELTAIDSETWETTIGVEVVRCRDCSHATTSFDETRVTCRYWAMNDYDDSESSYGYTLYPVVKPDGFCAWASRKESE